MTTRCAWCHVILLNKREQVLDDFHVASTEPAGGSVPVHVTLSSVMVYRVGGTIGLERTVGTPRECLIARSLE